MQWFLKPFDQLTLSQLYSILRLRCEVFIVEQVAYQDIDNLDRQAHHLFALDPQGEVCAYLRILPRGAVFDEAAIGRVCVRADFRQRGLASEMMDKALDFIENVLNEPCVHISAQQYLADFYKSKGFVSVGEGYLEDGIPHISMIRRGQ